MFRMVVHINARTNRAHRYTPLTLVARMVFPSSQAVLATSAQLTWLTKGDPVPAPVLPADGAERDACVATALSFSSRRRFTIVVATSSASS